MSAPLISMKEGIENIQWMRGYNVGYERGVELINKQQNKVYDAKYTIGSVNTHHRQEDNGDRRHDGKGHGDDSEVFVSLFVGDAHDHEQGDDGSGMGERIQSARRHRTDPVQDIRGQSHLHILGAHCFHENRQPTAGGSGYPGHDVDCAGGRHKGWKGQREGKVDEALERDDALYDKTEADDRCGIQQGHYTLGDSVVECF